MNPLRNVFCLLLALLPAATAQTIQPEVLYSFSNPPTPFGDLTEAPDGNFYGASTYGGLGQGFLDLVLLLEELWAALAPVPFLSTVVLAGFPILRRGSEAQRRRWLPGSVWKTAAVLGVPLLILIVIYNPMRVMPDRDACEVVFTLRRPSGMSDEEFERDAKAVAGDLARLKRIVEGRKLA